MNSKLLVLAMSLFLGSSIYGAGRFFSKAGQGLKKSAPRIVCTNGMALNSQTRKNRRVTILGESLIKSQMSYYAWSSDRWAYLLRMEALKEEKKQADQNKLNQFLLDQMKKGISREDFDSLLKQGAELQDSESGETILHWAVRKGDEALVRRCIHIYELQPLKNKKGMTPFALSIYLGKTDLVPIFSSLYSSSYLSKEFSSDS